MKTIYLATRIGATHYIVLIVLVCSVSGQSILFKSTKGVTTVTPLTEGTTLRFNGCDTMRVLQNGILRSTILLSGLQNLTFNPCDSVSTDIDEEVAQDNGLFVLRVFPNPSGPGSAALNIEVPNKDIQPFTIRVYDINGTLVRDFGMVEPNALVTRIIWDRKDLIGADVVSGTYLIHAACEGYSVAQLIFVIN